MRTETHSLGDETAQCAQVQTGKVHRQMLQRESNKTSVSSAIESYKTLLLRLSQKAGYDRLPFYVYHVNLIRNKF